MNELPDFYRELQDAVTSAVRWTEYLAGAGVSSVLYTRSALAGEKAHLLREQAVAIEGCTLCRLSEKRTQVVFGVGNPEADILFVGEGPGKDEDEQGIPFVGAAGQVLTAVITEAGLSRDEVYIANVVKCRPPGNRTPQMDEIETCTQFLVKQIETIAPKVIVAAGKPSAAFLLGDPELGITRAQGKVYHTTGWRWGNAKVVPIFHPSYYLHKKDEDPAKGAEIYAAMVDGIKLAAEVASSGK
ncbi:MAG: uracil-DNA glycosylase [Planctomycetes bacterium]|nr:uracil-DNA glycosylase [Planctomycetota bacterium]